MIRTINGDVSGKTLVAVDNTNHGPGLLNTVGSTSRAGRSAAMPPI